MISNKVTPYDREGIFLFFPLLVSHYCESSWNRRLHKMPPPRVDVNRVVPGLRHTGMGRVFGDRGIDWMRCFQRGRQTFGHCPDRLWPGVGGGSMLHSSSALSAA